MKSEELMIPYDRMKEQVEKELFAFMESIPSRESLSPPGFSYEKGTCRISFPMPVLNEQGLFGFLMLMKQYIANVRVHSLDEGYYAFQAMNSNLFKTENMLDNFKIEFFSLSSSVRTEISKKGNLSQEEVNLVIALYKRAYSVLKEDPGQRLVKLGASVLGENSSLDWDYIAGYEEVKRKIRESIILPLKILTCMIPSRV